MPIWKYTAREIDRIVQSDTGAPKCYFRGANFHLHTVPIWKRKFLLHGYRLANATGAFSFEEDGCFDCGLLAGIAGMSGNCPFCANQLQILVGGWAPPGPNHLKVCSTCGWWFAFRYDWREHVETHRRLPDTVLGAMGSLGTVSVKKDTLSAVGALRHAMEEDLHELGSFEPRALEELIAGVFHNWGYRVELTRECRDGGIDVFLYDGAGDIIAIQIKRTKRTIGVHLVREMLGAMVLNGATRGVFVSTSGYSLDAVRAARCARESGGLYLNLMDGDELLRMLAVERYSSQQTSKRPAHVCNEKDLWFDPYSIPLVPLYCRRVINARE